MNTQQGPQKTLQPDYSAALKQDPWYMWPIVVAIGLAIVVTAALIYLGLFNLLHIKELWNGFQSLIETFL